jgi:hypothetical protein
MLGEHAVALQGKLAPGQNVSCRERYGTGGQLGREDTERACPHVHMTPADERLALDLGNRLRANAPSRLWA